MTLHSNKQFTLGKINSYYLSHIKNVKTYYHLYFFHTFVVKENGYIKKAQ